MSNMFDTSLSLETPDAPELLTQTEIATAVGRSQSATARWLGKLRKEGVVLANPVIIDGVGKYKAEIVAYICDRINMRRINMQSQQTSSAQRPNPYANVRQGDTNELFNAYEYEPMVRMGTALNILRKIYINLGREHDDVFRAAAIEMKENEAVMKVTPSLKSALPPLLEYPARITPSELKPARLTC